MMIGWWWSGTGLGRVLSALTVLCSHLLVHSHIGLVLLILELVVLRRGVLILLIFADEVVHIALGLRELHLIHSLARIPMQKRLATKHRRELLRDAFEDVLNRRGVADEGRAHFQSARRISQMLDLTLLGIHSTKYELFLFWTFSICSSTSFVLIRPRNIAAAVK